MSTQNAVLMLVFNRADKAALVLEAVRQARPPRLYVSADGPRTGVDGDKVKTDQVRALFSGIDWDCELKTRFLPENLGCRKAVSSGIDWFFENEEQGIILEDDTLPNLDFFWYCDSMLERFRTESRVLSVSGSNLVEPWLKLPNEVCFTKAWHVWGWATWRHAWLAYDESMKNWPEIRANLGKYPSFPTGADRRYWKTVFDLVHADFISTWDHQWTLAHFITGKLSIMPKHNLVVNTGFDAEATHTSGREPEYIRLQKAGRFNPQLNQEISVVEFQEFYKMVSAHVLVPSFWTVLKLNVRRFKSIFPLLKKVVNFVRNR